MSEPIRLWSGRAPGTMADCQTDLPYMVPYPVSSDQTVPAIIVCPGGAYARHADHEGEPIARWLNSLGIAAFVLYYRVAPYRHPVPLLDARRAIRTVRYRASEWGVDPNRVGILGFSAGGHLAATASTHFAHDFGDANDAIDSVNCRPDLSILCYPVISFGPSSHVGSMTNLLGPDPDEELRAYMSAENHVTADTPPAFLWHTAEDAGVSVQHSLAYAEALSRAGVPFALHVFPTGRHGLGLAADHPEAKAWPSLCAAWLAQQGWAHSPEN